MSVRKRGRWYYVERQWRGLHIRKSCRTSNKARARHIDNVLGSLRDAGRADLLGLLADNRLDMLDLVYAYDAGPEQLEQIRAKAESPILGELLDDWFAWLESPAGISPRTRRRYAPQTVRRYKVSWMGFLEILPSGRSARLTEITSGFISTYKIDRVRAEGGSERHTRSDRKRPAAATINRDLVALAAFLRWCREERGFHFEAPRIIREREPLGRERWLSADELRAIEGACPSDWWPLFATLAYTGMRVGEAQGLRWGDIRLEHRRISIHEGRRRVKTASSVRDVPVPELLAKILAKHAARVRSNPNDPVFPHPTDDYGSARRQWRATCLRGGLHDNGEKPTPTATLHDLRHTYGVHAAQSGVPIVRLQQLLGHTTPHMTLRYMKHAPESFFEEDAAAISASLTGRIDGEEAKRANLAQQEMRQA